MWLSLSNALVRFNYNNSFYIMEASMSDSLNGTLDDHLMYAELFIIQSGCWRAKNTCQLHIDDVAVDISSGLQFFMNFKCFRALLTQIREIIWVYISNTRSCFCSIYLFISWTSNYVNISNPLLSLSRSCSLLLSLRAALFTTISRKLFLSFHTFCSFSFLVLLSQFSIIYEWTDVF